jgi:hypothetical protein
MPYATHRWKYIQYRDIDGADELYDLSNDSFELNNLIGDKTAPLQQIKRRLARLLKDSAAST